ncbi:hypothetical protein EV356DRAFT_504194 [Viridothelium virens]|uniref:BZIP domain-containing protein n=1 Tax=Viridothelium virens TaxID=1048519 RepID=A0A6A6HM05_VIRVR|nr:hypothetical protein EV356DRAFT_504194 [Viridothelium virens]
MESFDQLFDLGEYPGGDVSTVLTPPSVPAANERSSDLLSFDITTAGNSNSLDSKSMLSKIDTTIEPSRTEMNAYGPKVITSFLPSARHYHGQFTPPDDTPDFKPVNETNGIPALPQMSDNAHNDSPLSDAANIGDKRTDPEPIPNAIESNSNSGSKRRKRSGRKPSTNNTTSAAGDGDSNNPTFNSSDPHANPEEQVKREKFLERNRVAASKCRQRKKDWMSGLEIRARDLQSQRATLSAYAASLRDEVLYLKDQMLRHQGCGCTKIREYLNDQAEMVSPSGNLQSLVDGVAAMESRPMERYDSGSGRDVKYWPGSSSTTGSRDGEEGGGGGGGGGGRGAFGGLEAPMLPAKTDQGFQSMLMSTMPQGFQGQGYPG